MLNTFFYTFPQIILFFFSLFFLLKVWICFNYTLIYLKRRYNNSDYKEEFILKKKKKIYKKIKN